MGQEQSPCQETLPTAGSSWLWICGDQMIISMISASTWAELVETIKTWGKKVLRDDSKEKHHYTWFALYTVSVSDQEPAFGHPNFWSWKKQMSSASDSPTMAELEQRRPKCQVFLIPFKMLQLFLCMCILAISYQIKLQWIQLFMVIYPILYDTQHNEDSHTTHPS